MKQYILENINGEYAKEIARDFFEAGISIGEGEKEEQKVSYNSSPQNLILRSIPFHKSVFTKSNAEKYGQQMLSDFYEYWTEPNPSHTKMRFELQKTWDVNRRLARWARNNFNRNGNSESTTNQQRVTKLADILVG